LACRHQESDSAEESVVTDDGVLAGMELLSGTLRPDKPRALSQLTDRCQVDDFEFVVRSHQRQRGKQPGITKLVSTIQTEAELGRSVPPPWRSWARRGLRREPRTSARDLGLRNSADGHAVQSIVRLEISSPRSLPARCAVPGDSRLWGAG